MKDSFELLRPILQTHRHCDYALINPDFKLQLRGSPWRPGGPNNDPKQPQPLTPIAAPHVTDLREAQRRFRSLRAHVIVKRYERAIGVWERHQSGRIRFHLVVVLKDDIRSGADFRAFKRRDYRSANSALRVFHLLTGWLVLVHQMVAGVPIRFDRFENVAANRVIKPSPPHGNQIHH